MPIATGPNVARSIVIGSSGSGRPAPRSSAGEAWVPEQETRSAHPEWAHRCSSQAQARAIAWSRQSPLQRVFKRRPSPAVLFLPSDP